MRGWGIRSRVMRRVWRQGQAEKSRLCSGAGAVGAAGCAGLDRGAGSRLRTPGWRRGSGLGGWLPGVWFDTAPTTSSGQALRRTSGRLTTNGSMGTLRVARKTSGLEVPSARNLDGSRGEAGANGRDRARVPGWARRGTQAGFIRRPSAGPRLHAAWATSGAGGNAGVVDAGFAELDGGIQHDARLGRPLAGDLILELHPADGNEVVLDDGHGELTALAGRDRGDSRGVAWKAGGF